MAQLELDPNWKWRVCPLQFPRRSRIPLPTSPSCTLPSHIFSLWRDENGQLNVPVFDSRAWFRSLRLCSSPDNNIRLPRCIEYALTPDMEKKLQTQLKRRHLGDRRGNHVRDIKIFWRMELLIFKLEGAVVPPEKIYSSNVEGFCNKPTTFYWTEAAQHNGRCPEHIFGAIYKAWFRYHNENPKLDHKHFFANLVQITAPGPDTIHGIVEAHRLLFDQLSSFMSRVAQGSKNGAAPRISTLNQTPEHYHLLPLSRAIIVVYDEFIEPEAVYKPRYRIFLDKEARRQHVLLVLTGDDHDLSAPISFDSIRTESLPLNRKEITEGEEPYTMIRVPLITAINFILDLQHREEASCTAQEAPDWSSKSTYSLEAADRDATEWANNLLRNDRNNMDKGVESDFNIMSALKEIEALARGESPIPILDDEILDHRWE